MNPDSTQAEQGESQVALFYRIPSGESTALDEVAHVFRSTTALPIIQGEKNNVTRPPRRKVIVLHEFFELSEPPVHFSSPLAS